MKLYTEAEMHEHAERQKAICSKKAGNHHVVSQCPEPKLPKGITIPDIYTGKLNTARIKKYRNLIPLYTFSKEAIGDIFCRGGDWVLELITEQVKSKKK